MTVEQALTAAREIWGSPGFARQAGRNYQVGCQLSGTTIIVAASKLSFDDALSRVNMTTNGPHVLTAIATDSAGNQASSAPVPIFLCNP
jgi:hypothetical protein